MKTIREIMDIVGPDDAYMDKLKSDDIKARKIEKNIRFAFRKCGIKIAPYDDENDSVFYNPDERNARVVIFEDEITTDKLSLLMQSGLANNYKISASPDGLTIEFLVNEYLDNSI